MGHFPDNIITALKNAVINVFWRKNDVRRLFRECNVPAVLVDAQDWNAYKYNIVSPVVDALNEQRDGLGPLRRILQETLAYTSGDHLLWMTDGKKRKAEAERSLEHLRLLVKEHETMLRSKEEQRDARLKRLQEVQGTVAFQSKVGELRGQFLAECLSSDPQRRGYRLEQLLYDLFLLFEINPKEPFRRIGEQIDGAFVLDGDHFLLEAKWQQAPVNLSDLRDLDGAVGSSFENTLGLFVALNGFSHDALQGYVQGNRPRIICMDGADLMAVLECRIDLPDLLRRKLDIAVHKRAIFVTAAAIMQGEV